MSVCSFGRGFVRYDTTNRAISDNGRPIMPESMTENGFGRSGAGTIPIAVEIFSLTKQAQTIVVPKPTIIEAMTPWVVALRQNRAAMVGPRNVAAAIEKKNAVAEPTMPGGRSQMPRMKVMTIDTNMPTLFQSSTCFLDLRPSESSKKSLPRAEPMVWNCAAEVEIAADMRHSRKR